MGGWGVEIVSHFPLGVLEVKKQLLRRPRGPKTKGHGAKKELNRINYHGHISFFPNPNLLSVILI
jgi:hypothetical protein